jgi:hypothetical protein
MSSLFDRQICAFKGTVAAVSGHGSPLPRTFSESHCPANQIATEDCIVYRTGEQTSDSQRRRPFGEGAIQIRIIKLIIFSVIYQTFQPTIKIHFTQKGRARGSGL